MSKKPNTTCSKCNKSMFSYSRNIAEAICNTCRTMKTNSCSLCGKETKNNKYCSRSCSSKVNNHLIPKRKTTRKCTKCDSAVKSYRHSLCETHHEEYMKNRFDYIKELTLQDYHTKKSLDNLHISSKNAHIRLLARSHFKDLTKLPCYNCGYNKHVELCHIKPLRSFSLDSKIKEINSPNNIVQLCPNCHWEFDNGLLDLDFPEQSEFT